MRKNTLYRPLMMATGILAMLVILLSHSFYNERQAGIEKVKTAQTDQDTQKTFVSVPSDAVVSSPVAEVNEQVPSLLEEFVMSEQEREPLEVVSPLLTRYIKTLFRAIISPNAP